MNSSNFESEDDSNSTTISASDCTAGLVYVLYSEYDRDKLAWDELMPFKIGIAKNCYMKTVEIDGEIIPCIS